MRSRPELKGTDSGTIVGCSTDVLALCQRYEEVLKIPFTHVLGTKMTLLAEWGKPYQARSEVGYGVMTDKTRCAVMCIFHIWLWLLASSLCVTAKVTQQLSRLSDIPDNKTPGNKEILNITVDRRGQWAPSSARRGDSRLNVTADGGTRWRLRRGNL